MDKKQNFYSRQGSSKALASEPRKSSEVSVNKPRSARRRENPNFSINKNDSQRSSKPAKVRPYVDKRPRQRGGSGAQPLDISSSSSGLAEIDETFDGPSDELNSVYNQGSKKQNLNHLLNFRYSSREQDGAVGISCSLRNGNRNQKKHKYNKEQFLQANFQFVVNSEAASNIIADSSPDTLVDWSLIEQINIQTTEEPQCPICLYPPIAAKLTKCGHAYCWPCILHYLALTDKAWRKCPICYDAIHLKDLKSTAIVQQVNFNVGDIVTFQLMRRKKGSMFIEKISEEHDGKIPHMTADVSQKKFSKLLQANPTEILSIIERERNELISCESENCPEFVFIKQALDLLDLRKISITEEFVFPPNFISVDQLQINKLSLETNVADYPELGKEAGGEDKNLNCEVFEQNTLQPPKDNNKYYYFYQSVDGQNVFLHPLNVKMLQAMYGSLDKGPSVIKAQIIQKEAQSMDEEHRKKFTCLGHLPLTCQFEIVEIQLEPPLVSEEVLTLFRDDIVLRQKTRTRRARDEKRREREINEINERQMGKLVSRSANINIKSAQQFPTCGSEDGSFGEASFPYNLSDSPPVVGPSPSNITPNFTTFANILSSPKKEFWPSLIGASSSSSNTTETSWIKPVTVAANHSETNVDSASEAIANRDAAYYAKQNFGEVLAEALELKKFASGNHLEKSSAVSSCKKGKKNKKTLLFSTGMSFNGN